MRRQKKEKALKLEKYYVRGFRGLRFRDLYGKKASIQESSLATDHAIWFGCNEGLHLMGDCLARMHLNREQVGQLIPILEHFVKTGELPEGDK